MAQTTKIKSIEGSLPTSFYCWFVSVYGISCTCAEVAQTTKIKSIEGSLPTSFYCWFVSVYGISCTCAEVAQTTKIKSIEGSLPTYIFLLLVCQCIRYKLHVCRSGSDYKDKKY